jgi:hypothetical protein
MVPPTLTFSMIGVSAQVRARKWAAASFDTPLSVLLGELEEGSSGSAVAGPTRAVPSLDG